MPKQQPHQKKSPAAVLFTQQDRLAVSVMVASLLVLIVCYWCYRGGHQGKLIRIDRAQPLQAQYLVDINRADWPEIIQLPGLGETLAMRILVERQLNGPFLEVDELVRVNGIGPKTLKKIRPYLLPIPKDSDWAASGSDDAAGLQ